MTVASLPMYDLPEIEAATDEWWKGLARAFRREGISDVPDTLWRGQSYRELWTRSDLLLSQTCGYPLMHELRGKVTLVATPCYSAPGCNGPDYCSVVVVHEDSNAGDINDLEGTRCVVNTRNSQSGYNALRALIAPIALGKRFFRSVTISGSHPNSLKLVAESEADVAAIDCVTYALLTRYRTNAIEGIRPLCLTPNAPALPYITRTNVKDDLVARLHRGLRAACDDSKLSDSRKIQMLRDFCILPITEYERIADMEREAVACGSEFVEIQ
jgi:ABC-type phosphate/phosphonate transport system substrate-binding protein